MSRACDIFVIARDASGLVLPQMHHISAILTSAQQHGVTWLLPSGTVRPALSPSEHPPTASALGGRRVAAVLSQKPLSAGLIHSGNLAGSPCGPPDWLSPFSTSGPESRCYWAYLGPHGHESCTCVWSTGLGMKRLGRRVVDGVSLSCKASRLPCLLVL